MSKPYAGRRIGMLVVVAALIAVEAAVAGMTPTPRPDYAKQPTNRPTAVDNARASASIVRLSDLVPGFRVEAKPQQNTPVIPHCRTYPGDRSDVIVSGFAGSSFVHRANSIGSSVLYFKSGVDSDEYWKRTVRIQYVQCLAAALDFGPAKIQVQLAKQIPIGPTGADDAVAYRLIAKVTPPGEDPFYWTETAAFVKYGRAVGLLRIIYLNHLCECHTGLALRLTRRLRDSSR